MKKNNKIKGGRKQEPRQYQQLIIKYSFWKNSLGNKISKETNLTHIKTGRKNCVKGIPSLCTSRANLGSVFMRKENSE